MPPGQHSPGLALLFSLLLLGGGQLYNRQYAKGLVLIGSYIALVFGVSIVAMLTCGIGIILAVVLFPFSIATIVDAFKVAERLNRGECVDKWKWF